MKKYAIGNEKISQINSIWKEFREIYNQIKKQQLNNSEVKFKTKQWLNQFTTIYDAKHITPYMHCFGNHLHEFIEMYDDVNNFNVEGLEKLNHMTHSHVFRATNRNKDYLKQIMCKRNRMEVSCCY